MGVDSDPWQVALSIAEQRREGRFPDIRSALLEVSTHQHQSSRQPFARQHCGKVRRPGFKGSQQLIVGRARREPPITQRQRFERRRDADHSHRKTGGELTIRGDPARKNGARHAIHIVEKQIGVTPAHPGGVLLKKFLLLGIQGFMVSVSYEDRRCRMTQHLGQCFIRGGFGGLIEQNIQANRSCAFLTQGGDQFGQENAVQRRAVRELAQGIFSDRDDHRIVRGGLTGGHQPHPQITEPVFHSA